MPLFCLRAGERERGTTGRVGVLLYGSIHHTRLYVHYVFMCAALLFRASFFFCSRHHGRRQRCFFFFSVRSSLIVHPVVLGGSRVCFQIVQESLRREGGQRPTPGESIRRKHIFCTLGTDLSTVSVVGGLIISVGFVFPRFVRGRKSESGCFFRDLRPSTATCLCAK